ncbi:adenylosuccinate lyase [Candidatus Peregrinibacteria bacterium]|nr:adenylosuccinate lyase [Candidatus Peregrinibacteria bacterium]
MIDPLFSLSPLDGRYYEKVDELRNYFSEAGLQRYRILVEVEWFIFICNEIKLPGTKVIDELLVDSLRALYTTFDLIAAKRIKDIESITNHDVKAVEYYIKETMKGTGLEPYFEFIHFACTSEDINNTAYALMLQGAIYNEIVPLLTGVTESLYNHAKMYKSVSMLARTHGQPASPTTMGKEFVNVIDRIKRQINSLKSIEIRAKFNGAVGNYNAHFSAYPKINWANENKKFIQSLGLEFSDYSTQIECHDYMAELFDALKRINTVLLDFDRDIWMYISFGYFKQKVKEGEVGSSTMPHKVNPIDFENSEGNLGMANAILSHFSAKLPISRMQRDLSDSTVLRNIGIAFGYSMLGYRGLIKGLSKLIIDKEALKADLKDQWELLAEPIQTVMRRYKFKNPYEKLKELTRGKKITKNDIHKFLEKSGLPKTEIQRLKKISPENYVGIAEKLVEKF